MKFTTASTKEVFHKLDVYEELDKLMANIKLEEFVQSINDIGFVFQCFPLNNPRKVLEYKSIRRKTKTLELYLVLDYERIMQGTDEENLQHFKEVFVKGCEAFLKPIKGFRWEEFEVILKQIL